MTSVKISTTDELLAVMPYQLGYHLEHCVAILMVRDNLIGPVARFDLPPEKDVAVNAAKLLESLLRVGPDAALLVGYETVAGESRSLLDALHHGLLAAGVGLIDHVVVRDGRWWGWCCRPEGSLEGLRPTHLSGHPIPGDDEVPAVAEFIMRGSAPLSGRDAVSRLITEDRSVSGPVGDELERLWDAHFEAIDADGQSSRVLGDDHPAAGELDDDEHDDVELAEDELASDARAAEALSRVDRVPELWARVLEPEGERGDDFHLSDGELAQVLRSLVSKPWRDTLVAWMSPVMFPVDKADPDCHDELAEVAPHGPATTCARSSTILRRLQGLAVRTPDDWAGEAAAISTLVACVAWGTGDGAMSGDAVSRALRVAPTYTLARYVSHMIEYQMRPQRTWAEVDSWPAAS